MPVRRTTIMSVLFMAIAMLIALCMVAANYLKLDRDAVEISSKEDLARLQRTYNLYPLTVSITYCSISDEELSAFLQSYEIVQLDARNCIGVSDSAIHRIRSPDLVEVLWVRGTRVGPDLGKLLRIMPRLRNVDVGANEFTAFAHADAIALDKIVVLDCSKCRLTSAVIDGISRLPSVRFLNLSDVRGVSPDQLRPLTRILALEEINLSGVEVDSQLLQGLCSIKTLRHVMLTYPRGLITGDVSEIQNSFPHVTIHYTQDQRR